MILITWPLDFKKRESIRAIEWRGMPEAGMLFSTLFRAVQTSGSVVVPLPGVEVRIVDPISGVDVVPGLDGEIWLKGSAITPDYRHDSEQTGRLFVGEWFRSGYLGRLNKDGCIYLAGNLGVQNECCD